MSDTEIEYRINDLNLEMLNTLASLGEFVVAQNATLIELARLVSEDRKSKGGSDSLRDLSQALDGVKKESHEYIKTLKASVTKLQNSVGGRSDA